VTIRLEEISKHRIKPDPNQPRKVFEDIEELAESINVHGVLQPITVRDAGDGDFWIIAGERRWRGTMLSERDTIPCIVRSGDDTDDLFELQLLENVARKQMNPIEEAAAYQQLLDGGKSAAEIEKRLGLCAGMVAWQVKVLNCHDSVQHLVARGQYSLTQGTQLGRLSKDGQLVAMREQNQKGLSGNAFTALVNEIWARENQREMFPETKLDAATLDAADKFRSALTRLAKDSRTITAIDPDVLARAFAHELPMLEAEITAAMQALQRVKRGVQREGGRQAAQGLLV